MDGKPGRFVDRDQRVVFVQDRDREQVERNARRRSVRSPGAHRWNAHVVADREPRVGPHAPAIHAHLAAAQNAVDVTLGHPFQDAQEEIVHPLPGGRIVDREVPGNIFLA